MVPKIAIIIPVFKHSGLLPETVASALRQRVDKDFVIVLVNDGCPYEETDVVCRQYAMTYPGKIFYVHKPNGGLSSARNAGINFALAVFSELDAIYLMDADNRISPLLLQNSYDTLFSAAPEVGWAYPDIDKFGIEEFCDMSGPYNIFEHLLWNFCEAGSMVRREVFDSGLRYDENMKLGYEDWEFWLQCIEAGFVGTHVQNSGFKYRQRGESMLKDSERHHEEIMSYIKKKHGKLMGMSQFYGHEHRHAPRYALYLSDTRQFAYLSDAYAEPTMKSYAEFKDAFISGSIKPEVGQCPPYLIITTSRFYSFLMSLKVLSGLLWRMQTDLEGANFTQLGFDMQQDRAMEIALSRTDAPHSPPALLMCKTQTLQDCVNDEDGGWLLSMDSQHPQPNIAHSTLWVRADFSPPRSIDASKLLIALYHELHNDRRAIYDEFYQKTSVQYFRQSIAMPANYCSRLFHLRHTLPLARPQNGLNIGIILPVAEFGGVEKVAFNYAEVLRNHGHQLHLFVVGRPSAHIPSSFESTFSSITFYRDDALGQYAASTSNHNYLGSPLPTWNEHGNMPDALGMLAGMNVVINFNVVEFNSLMSSLRKLGIKAYTSQHLIDRSPFNQPQGTPHQFLAYEHAYDGVLVISQQLIAWFLANGVPGAKLLHIPNAASYPMEARKRQRILNERENRKHKKMRVLYIGRFDRQKGLDRLAAVIRRSEEEGLDIEWRVVGKAILGGGEDQSMEVLAPYLHPVAMTTDELNEHFAWADAMVLVSRFEGVPLTILEAGRLGCAILATNVGAIEESFVEGTTGYLFESEQDEEALIAQVMDRLREMASDKALLRHLNKGAADYYGGITWERSMQPFIQHISSLMGN